MRRFFQSTTFRLDLVDLIHNLHYILLSATTYLLLVTALRDDRLQLPPAKRTLLPILQLPHVPFLPQLTSLNHSHPELGRTSGARQTIGLYIHCKNAEDASICHECLWGSVGTGARDSADDTEPFCRLVEAADVLPKDEKRLIHVIGPIHLPALQLSIDLLRYGRSGRR